MTPIDKVLGQLPGRKKSGRGWSAQCPAHDDRKPSLSIGTGEDGRVLLHCHSGCPTSAVVAAIGLTMRDLFPSIHGRKS